MSGMMLNVVGGTFGGNVLYWIGLLGGGSFDSGNGVAVDGSGNAYICGYSNASGIENFQIAKYSTLGAIQWQRRLGDAGAATECNSIAVSSAGNVYICGLSEASGTFDLQIAKYNTSGAIQWQRRLGGADNDYGYSVAIDASENVYVVGQSGSNGDLQIAKYNTSGTIQWQRSISEVVGYTQKGYGIAVDASGNSYSVGYSYIPITSSNDGILFKYDTSGTLQWQMSFGDGNTDISNAVAVDSSGDVYVCGYHGIGGVNDIQIAKYNSSGTIQWQRKLVASNGAIGFSVATDLSNNVYICGQGNNSTQLDGILAKYNASGVIQWQRSLGGTAVEVLKGVFVQGESVFVCGRSTASGSNDFLFAKLPIDGSATGTYTVGGYSFIYGASTLTDAATTFSSITATFTSSTSTLTDTATTLTDAATTLTSSVTTI
jgi:hypothetical protein